MPTITGGGGLSFSEVISWLLTEEFTGASEDSSTYLRLKDAFGQLSDQ
jgi:hypothetical protein